MQTGEDLLKYHRELKEIMTENMKAERHQWPRTDLLNNDSPFRLSIIITLIIFMHISTFMTHYTVLLESDQNLDELHCRRYIQQKLKEILMTARIVRPDWTPEMGSSGSIDQQVQAE